MRTPAAISPPAERTVPILAPRDEPDAIPRTQRVAVDTTPLPAILAGGFPRVRGYDILGVIGSGGMGIVYEARHRELNRRVALKTLRGEGLADPEFRERFRAEAEAIAKLQHPNVIQVFEVGTVEGAAGELHPSPFIALEFVDGGSLAARARAPQQPTFAARIVATLARAAHAAHLLGVIHRDLKPANVLLDRDGEPKVADFGIAKQLDTAGSGPLPRTRTGIVMGTPEYMSPEQLEGDTASPSIDIYALGVILYELLTGRVPFKGATFTETMRLTLNQEPVPPHRLQPGVPRDLETICLKCLEKSPKKRYATAEALADDLARWLDGRPILARPLGVTGRAARWAKRNPTVAALSAAVLLVTLAGLGGIMWSWDDALASKKRSRELMHTAQTNAARANDEADKNREAAERERWERYRLCLLTASTALWSHDVLTARRALDEAPEKYRDWVWELINAQLDRSRRVISDPAGPINITACDRSGRWMAARPPGGELTVWDLAAQQQYGPFPGVRAGEKIAVADDGTVAFNGTDLALTVLDPRTGDTRTLAGHTQVSQDFFFLDGGPELISCSNDRTVRVWNTVSGREAVCFRVPAEAKLPAVLSPDGAVVGSRWDGPEPPTFWEVRTGKTVGTLATGGAAGMGYTFSPDGRRIVAHTPYPSTDLLVFDIRTNTHLFTLIGHENNVRHLAFSPKGERLATCSMDRTVRLWDLAPGEPGARREARHVLEGHSGWIERVAFSADGTRLLSAAEDRTLRLWNVPAGRQLAALRGHTGAVYGGWFFADGIGPPGIASHGADGTIRLWDAAAAENDYALRGHESYVYSAAFFPDGARIASCAWDDTARVWDAYTGKQALKIQHGGLGIVSSVAVHPDGKRLATLARKHQDATAVGGVRLWDAGTGALLHTWPLQNSDYRDGQIAFDPDGKLLAAGTPSGDVHVWDVETKRTAFTVKAHAEAVKAVAFSPDGKLLATAGAYHDGTVGVWDAATGKLVARLGAINGECVFALAWHPTENLLAAGASDGAVRLWNPRTGEPVGVMQHRSDVFGLAFSPDGKLLATGANDNLVRLWHVGTRREIAELSGHKLYVHSVAFDRDGTRLLSASGDRTVRVWDTDPQRAKEARLGNPLPR